MEDSTSRMCWSWPLTALSAPDPCSDGRNTALVERATGTCGQAEKGYRAAANGRIDAAIRPRRWTSPPRARHREAGESELRDALRRPCRLNAIAGWGSNRELFGAPRTGRCSVLRRRRIRAHGRAGILASGVQQLAPLRTQGLAEVRSEDSGLGARQSCARFVEHHRAAPPRVADRWRVAQCALATEGDPASIAAEPSGATPLACYRLLAVVPVRTA